MNRRPGQLSIAEIDAAPTLSVRRGRNRNKAELRVCRAGGRCWAVKDYRKSPWWIRHTVGRAFVARETRAYERLAGVPGIAPFAGRLGSFTLATEHVDASSLAEHADGSLTEVVFDRLDALLAAIHERGVVLCDLTHRDVLVSGRGRVYAVDLATAWILPERPGPLRRRLFRHLRDADRFRAARLRARFTGSDAEAAVRDAAPGAVAWHRRARRAKYLWDRLRGAQRLPPTGDHWRF